MILKVVHARTLATGSIANYTVVYDSGTVRKFTHRNVPKSVTKFMTDHKAHVKTIGSDWVVKTYIYNEVRDGKKGVKS